MDEIRLNEQALLIKCLNCRLIQRPPEFNLAPPPMPPVEILNELSLPMGLFSSSTAGSSSLALKKRCLRIGNFLNRLWTSKQTLGSAAFAAAATSAKRHEKLKVPLEPSLEIDASQLLTTSANINNRLQNGSTHYVLMFLISFIVFLFLFTTLLLFVYKLFRIRKKIKQLESKKSVFESIGQPKSSFVDNTRPHAFFNCISSSLISSSSCSLPTASVTRNNSTNSESSTINSQLITTTTSSLLAASSNEQQTHLFNERERMSSNNYSTIKQDRCDEYKQLTNQQQNHMPICFLNLGPVLSNDGHYLQAVPINLGHYQLQQQHQLQQPLLLGGDYAEISSQCGAYNNYNQCETDPVNLVGSQHSQLFQMPNAIYHPILRLDERENIQGSCSLESFSS